MNIIRKSFHILILAITISLLIFVIPDFITKLLENLLSYFGYGISLEILKITLKYLFIYIIVVSVGDIDIEL